MKMHPLNKSARIVAAANKSNNIITGVTIIESPDIVNWLSGGEMLLTSLHPINFEAINQRDFILNLSNKGVSALVIKVHRYVQDIPQQVIEYANEFGLPIIELEGDTKYVDVMYPIMAELFNHQVTVLKYYKEVHDRFTALALKGENLEVILSSLEQLVKNPVAIYDTNFSCIASTTHLVNKLSEVNNKSRPIKNDNKFFYYQNKVILEELDGQEFTQVIVPIYGLNRQTSVFLTVLQINRQLEELDYISIENAATVICLEMVKRFAVGEVEIRFRNELIDEIISGGFDSKNIQDRANLIGWNLDRPYVVMLFAVDNLTQKISKDKKTNEIKEISLLISSSIRNYTTDFIIGRKHNTFIILYAVSDPESKEQELMEEIKKSAKDAQTEIKKTLKKSNVAVGIGTIAYSLNDISRSYQEALDAISFGKIVQKQNSLMAFRELGIFRILCKLTERDCLREYIPESLRKIIQHDKDKNSSLLQTLEVFLECNNNATKAAEKLFIHYKTILYRLERVQDIGGINLECKEDRLQLELGLKILHLLKEIG